MKLVFISVLCGLLVLVQSRVMKNKAVDHDEIHGRIIGGEFAAEKQFPYQVGLVINSMASCGGSLIHPQWILTAAHCVQGYTRFSVRLGSIKRSESDPNAVTIVSNEGIAHAGYVNPSLHNDIALIKLPTPVKLNENIQVVKLSNPEDYVKPGSPLVVSGFGQTENGSSQRLKFANLSSITNDKCADYYQSQAEIIYESTLCCQNEKKESTCFGDSGGPLVKYDNKGNPIQVGVVSFVSNRGCASGDPSGYVRTSEFRDWIKEKTNGDVF